MEVTLELLIAFWQQKKDHVEKSIAFLTLDPQRQKPYIEILPFIEHTINILSSLRLSIERYQLSANITHFGSSDVCRLLDDLS